MYAWRGGIRPAQFAAGVASAMIALEHPSVGLADDVTGDMTPRPMRIITTTTSESTSSGSSASNKNDDDADGGPSYSASMEKEKKKQAVEKKRSKEERRRELCETLGRGC